MPNKKSQLLTDAPSKGDPKPATKLPPEKAKTPVIPQVTKKPLLPEPSKRGKVL